LSFPTADRGNSLNSQRFRRRLYCHLDLHAGNAGAFVVGVVVLGEPLTIGRVLAAALIIAGVTLMKLSSSA